MLLVYYLRFLTVQSEGYSNRENSFKMQLSSFMCSIFSNLERHFLALRCYILQTPPTPLHKSMISSVNPNQSCKFCQIMSPTLIGLGFTNLSDTSQSQIMQKLPVNLLRKICLSSEILKILIYTYAAMNVCIYASLYLIADIYFIVAFSRECCDILFHCCCEGLIC